MSKARAVLDLVKEEKVDFKKLPQLSKGEVDSLIQEKHPKGGFQDSMNHLSKVMYYVLQHLDVKPVSKTLSSQGSYPNAFFRGADNSPAKDLSVQQARNLAFYGALPNKKNKGKVVSLVATPRGIEIWIKDKAIATKLNSVDAIQKAIHDHLKDV